MTSTAFAAAMRAVCATKDAASIKRLGPALCIQALLERDPAFAEGVTVLDERMAQLEDERLRELGRRREVDAL